MIAFLNRYSGMEHFMNIGYADSLAEYFLYPVGLSSKRLPERLARPLTADPPEGEVILVVGCGRGGEAVLLHELTGRSIIGIDITPFNIETARKHAQKKGVAGNVTFLLGDACDLPVGAASVSCVFSCESAFHYEDKGRFIRESYRVLKEGGLLLIADIVRKMPEEKLLENEIQTLHDFGRMLSAPEYFSMDEYRSHIERAGFSGFIDSEVITRHNLDFMARGSALLVKLYSLVEKVPGIKDQLRRVFQKRNINIENFIKHSRTTTDAVTSKLVDYIIISAQK